MRALAMIWLAVVMMACTSAPLNVHGELQQDPGIANVAAALDSTVNIWGDVMALDGKTKLGRLAGTGVIISVKNNVSIILTAGHVFHPNTSYIVENARGQKHSATFYHVSKIYDLGLLWVNMDMGTPASLAVAMPRMGAATYVVGNKLGGGLMPTAGIYGGLISSKFARCSAQTHPGNSGGGAWTNSQLIGIVSRIPGTLHQIDGTTLRSKQLYPSVSMFVPIQAVHEYLVLTGAKKQMTRPKALEKATKVILPPTPDKWKTEIR